MILKGVLGSVFRDWVFVFGETFAKRKLGGRLAVGLIGEKERSTVSSREKQRDSLKFKLMWSANRPVGSRSCHTSHSALDVPVHRPVDILGSYRKMSAKQAKKVFQKA